MLNLSLNEMKLIIKTRSIKGYKSMSEERLLSAPSESESVKSEENLDNNKKDQDQRKSYLIKI